MSAAKKIAWHTDIVVDGQGMNLKLKPGRDGCYELVAMPDVPGRPARSALAKFKKAVARQPDVCTVSAAKANIERAIRSSKAKWNRWHREAYT